MLQLDTFFLLLLSYLLLETRRTYRLFGMCFIRRRRRDATNPDMLRLPFSSSNWWSKSRAPYVRSWCTRSTLLLLSVATNSRWHLVRFKQKNKTKQKTHGFKQDMNSVLLGDGRVYVTHHLIPNLLLSWHFPAVERTLHSIISSHCLKMIDHTLQLH